MKKLIMMAAVALCVASVSVSAQKPVKGEFATEILLNPWNNGGNTFSLLDGVKGRYFISDKMAIRTTVNYGMSNITTEDNVEGVSLDAKFSQSNFSVAPGIEFHFGKWDKVSLYGGFEVSYFTQNGKYTSTTNGLGNTYKKEITGIYLENGELDLDNPNAALSGFGAGAFTGIDYYISQNLYLGAEFGLQYASASAKKMKITETGEEDIKTTADNKTSTLKFYSLPSVRVGWKF